MDYKDLAKYQAGGYQFPKYESMYVDLKRPEISQTLSNRYDTNKSEYDALQRAMGSVKTLEGDAYRVQDLKNRVEGNLSGVVDSGAFEFGSMAVNDSLTDFVTDRYVQDAVKSYENRDAELKTLSERRAKGLQTYDFGYKPVKDLQTGMVIRDPNTGEVMYEHTSKTHDSSQSGVYQPLAEQRLNAEDKARQLMQGIANDAILLSRVSANLGLSPAEAALYLKSGSGVSGNKIRQVAQAVLPVYMETPEGTQKMRALQELEINDFTGGTYNTDEAADVLLQDLISVASPQRGSTLTYRTNEFAKAMLDADSVAAPFQPDTRRKLSVNQDYKPIDDEKFAGLFENGSLKRADSMAEIAAASALGAGIGAGVGTIVPGVGTAIGGITGAGISGIGAALANKDYLFEDIPHEESLKRFRNALKEKEGDLLRVEGNETGLMLHLMDKYSKFRKPDDTDEDFSRRVYTGVMAPIAQLNNVYALSNKGEIAAANALGRNVEGLQVLDSSISEGQPFLIGDWAARPEVEGMIATQQVIDDFKAAALSPNLAPVKDGASEGSFMEVRGLVANGPLAGGYEVVFKDREGDPYTIVVADKERSKRRFESIGSIADLIASGDESIVKESTLYNPADVISDTGKQFTPKKQKVSLEYDEDSFGNISPMIRLVYTDGINVRSSLEDISMLGRSVNNAISSMLGDPEGELMGPESRTRTTSFP